MDIRFRFPPILQTRVDRTLQKLYLNIVKEKERERKKEDEDLTGLHPYTGITSASLLAHGVSLNCVPTFSTLSTLVICYK